MSEVITPSSVWQGNAVSGSRWTAEQHGALAMYGVKDPESVATATIERRPRVNAADWTMPPALVSLVVPRLALTRDGRRAKIVTPAGAIQWIEVRRG